MSLDQVVFESRPLDHEDDRRKLVSAFNGDFRAENVQGFSTTNMGASLCAFKGDILGVPTNTLFFILSGSAEVIIEGEKTNYSLQSQNDLRGRLFVPKERGYLVNIGPYSRLSISLEQARNSELGNLWLYGTHQNPDPNDRQAGTWKYFPPNRFEPAKFESAEVRTLFNAKDIGFTAAQLKFLLPFDQEVVLGGHYHNYRESFSMWKGKTTFRMEPVIIEDKILEDVGFRIWDSSLAANEGDYHSVPRRAAHGARADPHSILVGCTEEAFQSQDSAKPYRTDWLMFKE